MNQILLEKALNLKEAIESSLEVKELERLNKLLNESDEVMVLAYKKDCAATKYEDAIKYFGDNSKEAQTAQKQLHQAKLDLDNNTLVQQYYKQYRSVKEMYNKINKELFDNFN